MKTYVKLFTVACLFFFAGHLSAQNTENRDLSDFNAVHSSGSLDVELIAGNSNKVKISISGAELEDVVTEVESGTLRIRMKNGIYRNVRGKVEVTYKKLDKIKSSGSGNVKFVSTFEGNKLELNMSGSGNASGEIKVSEADLSISGSANVSLSGSADNAELSVSGSGNFNCKSLKTKESNVHISGSGDVKIYASERIDARVSGSGNIRYSGSPKKVISKANGSGNIRSDSK